jgi:hypothetical protein
VDEEESVREQRIEISGGAEVGRGLRLAKVSQAKQNARALQIAVGLEREEIFTGFVEDQAFK